MGMNALSTVCMTALYIGLRLENRRRASRQNASPTESSVERSDEKDPDFRYRL